jgi:hypothetical protein
VTWAPDGSGALRFDTVTFLSDYGRTDEFVGVVHSVIRQLAPGVGVVDLTHDIAPFDVRAAGLTLARSAQYVCPGVVLAVVDPGVGTDRRAVAIEVAGGAAVFVGPDNGLFAGAAGMVGGAERAVLLDNADYHLPSPGPTFDGRDVFAPVAAHLCLGVPLELIGTPIDTSSLTPGLLPLSEMSDDGLAAEVLWVDRFGNAQLNVDPDDLAPWGDRVSLLVGGRTRLARRYDTFAEVGVGEIGLIVDSYGLVTLVANRSSAAEELRIDAGDPVQISALTGDAGSDAVSTTTTVQLGRRPGEEARS